MKKKREIITATLHEIYIIHFVYINTSNIEDARDTIRAILKEKKNNIIKTRCITLSYEIVRKLR